MNSDDFTVLDVHAQGARNFVEERLKPFNLYTIPQIVWLAELYYLLFNSFFVIANELNETAINIQQFPPQVKFYNELIFKYLDEWIPFIEFLSFGFLISGLLISTLRVLPYVSDYKIIMVYAGYGIKTFIWFFLIAISYNVYSWSPSAFSLWFIFAALISSILTRLKGTLSEKFGI